MCKLQFDELYSVINTATLPMLVNPDGAFHTYKIVAFGPKSLEIEKLDSRFSIMYRFADGVDEYAVSKKNTKIHRAPRYRSTLFLGAKNVIKSEVSFF